MDAKRTRLKEVLAAYGADSARWPVTERQGLELLAANEPELLAETREIDRLLATARAPQVPAGAAARLLAKAGQQKPSPTVVPFDRGKARTRPTPSIWSWGAAAALAASFGLGIFLGTTNFAAKFGDSGVVEIDDPIVLTGIDDATQLLEGS